MRKKIKKCFIKPLFALCSLTAAVLFAGVLYLQSYLPANYYVYEGSSLSVQGPVPLSCEKSALAAPVENTLGAQSYTVNLKAFGVIPVKSAAVQVINNRKVKVRYGRYRTRAGRCCRACRRKIGGCYFKN